MREFKIKISAFILILTAHMKYKTNEILKINSVYYIFVMYRNKNDKQMLFERKHWVSGMNEHSRF